MRFLESRRTVLVPYVVEESFAIDAWGRIFVTQHERSRVTHYGR